MEALIPPAPTSSETTPGGFPLYPSDGRGYPLLPAPSTFTSVKAALAWAEAAWPHISWEFKGLDPSALGPLLTQLHRLSLQWPEPMHRLERVQPAITGRLIATNYDCSSLWLPSQYFGDAKLLQTRLSCNVEVGDYPHGCDSIEALTTLGFAQLYQSWITAYGETDPDVAIPSATSCAPYVSMRQEFPIVARTLGQFRRSARQKGLAKDLRNYPDPNDKAKMRFAFGFMSALHTNVSFRTTYALRVGALLELLERKNWHAAESFSYLHRCEGEELEESFYLLDELAEQVGFEFELLQSLSD